MPEDKINIVRSRRRTLAIEVTDTARVLVRAPRHVAQREIDAFIEKNANWVARKYREAVERFSLRKPKYFIEGEYLLLLGVSYPVICIKGMDVYFDGSFTLPQVSTAQRVQQLEQWYRKYADRHFNKRVDILSKKMGVIYTRVRISNARSRWGSCSSKGSININWRLIMAPSFVIDYVIVHELSHMVHMNHSKRFWSHVSNFYPDHRHAKKWLNKYGFILSLM